MSLKHSYTLIAPFYDAFLDAATRGARRKSLAALADAPPLDVLVNGVGTGLDLPHLPPQHRYAGLDLTRAMLRKALPRAAVLADVPGVALASNESALASGWFRLIRLSRT